MWYFEVLCTIYSAPRALNAIMMFIALVYECCGVIDVTKVSKLIISTVQPKTYELCKLSHPRHKVSLALRLTHQSKPRTWRNSTTILKVNHSTQRLELMILSGKWGKFKENNNCLCVLDHRSGRSGPKRFLVVEGEESDTSAARSGFEFGFKV